MIAAVAIGSSSLAAISANVVNAAPGVGGTITDYVIGSDKYIVHSFTSTGTTNFTTPSGVTSVDYLIVGGGGGGGTAWIDQTGGSGGGGGQVLSGTATVTPETDYSIVVGTGGAGGVLSLTPSITGQNGANGTASSAFGISAGGGYGAIKSNSGFGSPGTGKAGNSGGNLFTGANGIANGYCQRGGGGAGAGENGYVGQNVSSGATDVSTTGSKGGAGVASTIRTGSSVYYGGGGGGAGTGNCAQGNNGAGSGGLGGGGHSASWNGWADYTGSGRNGAANTGGGGGGQSGYYGQGGNGGSGIVVVRYLAPQTVTWAPTTALSTTDSPSTPSALATALGGASITYAVVSHTTDTCTVNSTTAVLNFTGSGNCVVRATAAPVASLQSASTSVTFTVSRVTQSALTVTSTTGVFGVSTQLSTSGGSGSGAVSYAVTGTGTASGCSVSGSTLTTTSTGTCKITATKAADSTYGSRSSAETTVTISRGTQATLTVTTTSGTVNSALPILVTGGTGTGALTFELLSGGTASCTITGSSILATSTGTCRIKVVKAADSNVSEQSATETITFAAAISQANTPAIESSPTQLVDSSPSTVPSTETAVSKGTTTAPNPTSTVAPTTTVARTETATVAAPEIVEVDPGSGAVEIDGEIVEGTTSRVDNQVIINAGSFTIGISAVDENGLVKPLNADGNVFVQPQDLIKVSATGFQSASDVAVWMFSTPTQLGSVTVTADGKLEGTFTIPKSAESGDHRIALIGKDVNGKDAKFAVGLLVGSTTQLSTTAKVLIAVPIIGAIVLGLLLPTQIRRRRRLRAL